MREPKYAIGQQFKTRGKCHRICTVSEVLRVYNSTGELVRVYYEATYEFIGQTITAYEVPEATITIGLIKNTI